MSVLSAEPARPKALDSFPQSDKIWLGSYGGQVEVDPATDLVASRPGEIRWLVDDEQSVTTQQAVALMGNLQILQSARQLEIDEAQLPLRKREAEWSHREKSAAVTRQIEELQTKQAKLELTPAEIDLVGRELNKRLQREREKIQQDILNLREKIDPELLEQQLKLELAQFDQDIERSRLEHEELIRSSEILAEHDGAIDILKSGYVRANNIVGRIRRVGHASVAIAITDPEIRSETPESLTISVMASDGTDYPGTFTKLERGNSGRFGAVTYFFDLKADPDNPPPAELSGERIVTIYKTLPEPGRIVTKSPLLFANAEEIRDQGWANFLRTVWPDARILHIGPQSIALAPIQ